MQHWRSDSGRGGVRRLILGIACALGLSLAALPHTTIVRAAGVSQATVVAQADPAAPKATPKAKGDATAKGKAADAPSAAETSPPKAADPGADADEEADTEDETAGDAAKKGDEAAKGTRKGDKSTVTIEKGRQKIRIEGVGRDREYDSFEQFMHEAPALAGLVFTTVLTIFLIPLLIVVLLVWYKLRKNRIANETMLKLAERGVVPPATAMDAVASGTAASVVAAAPPPGNPAYEQARYLRRRTVWSDLRKGVILAAVGLGLNFWAMFDDGTPNGFGLILLFVGLGYCLLWFFEDRTTTQSSPPPPPSVPASPPPPPPPGSV